MRLGVKTENEAEETDTGTPGKSLQEGRREVRYLVTQSLLDRWTGPGGRRASFRPGGLALTADRPVRQSSCLSAFHSQIQSQEGWLEPGQPWDKRREADCLGPRRAYVVQEEAMPPREGDGPLSSSRLLRPAPRLETFVSIRWN